MKRILQVTAVLALLLFQGPKAVSQDTGGAEAPAVEGSPEMAIAGESQGNARDSEDLEMLQFQIEGNQGSLIGSWSQARDLFWWGKGIDESPAQKASREPTVVGTPTGPVRLPVLRGVMIVSDKDRVAILGDDRVREGDLCQGFQVLTIKSRKVILTRDGKEYVLYVKE